MDMRILVGIVGIALSCAVSAEVEANFAGVGVNVINGITMGCTKPYELARDCSGFSGAKRVVPALPAPFKVAGSEDGTVVFVMSTSFVGPSTGQEERAALTVRDIGADLGATLLKVEAVSAGKRIMGYVLSFDRPVYGALQTHPGLKPMQSAEAKVPVPELEQANIDGNGNVAAAPDPASQASGAAMSTQRYALLTLDSGGLTLTRVGTTAFSNASILVTTPNRTLSNLAMGIADRLSAAGGYTLVHHGLKLEPSASEAHGASGYWAKALNTDARRVLQAKLTAIARRLATEHSLRWVVVIGDWASHDSIHDTNQTLYGHGVYFREFVDLRKISVYVAARLSAFDASTGRWSDWEHLWSAPLDASRWLELRADNAVPLEPVVAFVNDVEKIAKGDAELAVGLCEIGLLPSRSGTSGGLFRSDCGATYRH